VLPYQFKWVKIYAVLTFYFCLAGNNLESALPGSCAEHLLPI